MSIYEKLMFTGILIIFVSAAIQTQVTKEHHINFTRYGMYTGGALTISSLLMIIWWVL